MPGFLFVGGERLADGRLLVVLVAGAGSGAHTFARSLRTLARQVPADFEMVVLLDCRRVGGALIDEMRRDVRSAVRALRRAGVWVFVLDEVAEWLTNGRRPQPGQHVLALDGHLHITPPAVPA